MTDTWINLLLRLQALTWTDWLDLALVTLVFFILVTALQRVQATLMLRGLALIGFLLLVVAFLLPLPTFGLLIRGIMVFLLIAIPVVFQRELRHLLENVGRRIGFAPSGSQQTEELIQPLVRALEEMAARHTGALIVMQGEMALDEVVETGVAIGGQVTSELLTSIFYDKNPLHDGAVVIRGQSVDAAACVLPVTRRRLGDNHRLGTRHRAAVGLSERTDALVLVVSEETGDISVAQNGVLQCIEEQTALRERIADFGRSSAVVAPGFSLSSLFKPDGGGLQPGFARTLRRVAARLGLALLFAVGLWWFVLSTSGDLPDVQVGDVPLQVEGNAPDLAIAGELPETVDLTVRTTEAGASGVDKEAFVAQISLDELSEGVHNLPVKVTSRLDAPVQIVEVDPATVEVDLAHSGERSLPVTVKLETERLPTIYEVEDEPSVTPENVTLSGPQPLLDQLQEVRATLALSNTFGLVQSVQPLVPVDADGNEVQGLMVHPAEAEVSVDVARRANMREIGVAITTDGEPAPGFWISGLSAQPSTVVLNGPENLLATVGGAAPTTAVDIAGAAGDVTADVPLDLPAEVSAQTPEGEPLRTVQVTVRVTARRGNLTIERPVEISPVGAASNFSVTPGTVELLLTGPIATLREIQADPDMVHVILEAKDVDLSGGESLDLMPQVVAPEGVGVQLVPPSVTVGEG